MTFLQKYKFRKAAKNDLIIIYGVFSKKDPDFQGFPVDSHPSPAELMQHYDIITIVSSPKEAAKAVDKLVYFNHISHFVLWCQSHECADTCSSVYPSWEKYKLDVIGPEALSEEYREYSIFSLNYTRKDLASILRVFSNCRPLLLPEEAPIELQHYLSKHSDPTTNTTSLPVYLVNLMVSDVVDGPKLQSLLNFTEDQNNKK